MANASTRTQPAKRPADGLPEPDFSAQLAALERALEGRLALAHKTGEAGPRLASRYQVEAILARGGFGLILEAADLQLARRVALKLVPIVGSNRRELDRMAREGRALARIDNPGVVRVFDSGSTEVEPGRSKPLACTFVAMELLRGETLAQWSEARPRELAEQLSVLIRAGYGLIAVHEVGLVHRDVKPSNVMVGKGRVVWVDFGLARLAHEWGDRYPPTGADPVLSGKTTVGSVVGTPQYMAPEVRLGEPGSFASDQWSFAAMCWESLTGKRPEVEGSRVKLRRWWLVPRGLRAPLRKALELRPDDRLESLAALVDQLADWTQVAFAKTPAGLWFKRLGIAVAVVATPVWADAGKAVIDGVADLVRSGFALILP